LIDFREVFFYFNIFEKNFANSSEITSFADQFPQRKFARMAELVDALDSKSSSRKGVGVRFPLRVQGGKPNYHKSA
jgi:hypothetical protein